MKGACPIQVPERGEPGTRAELLLRLRMEVSLAARRESDLDTCLVQAIPARSGRMETIVRQVTELGVCRIVPVVTERGPWAR